MPHQVAMKIERWHHFSYQSRLRLQQFNQSVPASLWLKITLWCHSIHLFDICSFSKVVTLTCTSQHSINNCLRMTTDHTCTLGLVSIKTGPLLTFLECRVSIFCVKYFIQHNILILYIQILFNSKFYFSSFSVELSSLFRIKSFGVEEVRECFLTTSSSATIFNFDGCWRNLLWNGALQT